MNHHFQAEIGANIRKFQQKMKQVDATIREAASGATVGIGAQIREFMSKVAAIEAEKNKLQHGETEVTITAVIRGFMRGAALVRAQAMKLGAERIVIPIRARLDNYRNVMGNIANFSRNIGEVTSIMGRGGMVLLSPAAVPVIASAVGLLGQLGPMVGTILGSTFALASAFGTAGIGAAAFGAIAVTNLRALFDENAKLNKEQQKGLDALNGFKKTWSDIAGSFESETLSIFTQGLNTMSAVLTTLKPMFSGVMTAAQGLMTSLNQSINAAPMQAFFDYLNVSAGPMFETITKSVGNFMQGLFSMMTAFGPLATNTAAGFLKMSEGFAAWAANLSGSEKFQAFVAYVQENMPKVRSIFSDAIQGMINMFAGFGPSSADMMSGLQDMMERFKQWSSTISENQGFQKFIDYIRTNGPTVLSTIGEIVTLITNLGIALAPTGEKILGLVKAFTSWANGMMESHPWIGKLIAGALVLGGGLMLLGPAILLVNSLFSGLTLMMGKVVVKLAAMAIVFVAKWSWIATQAAFHAARVGIAWTVTTGAKMVVALAKMAATATIFVAKWLLIGTKALLHAAKVAAAWALSTGTAMVTSLAKLVATSAIFVAKWLWMGAQALFAAGRMAAAWFIALGPIGWVIAAVIALVILIIANWDTIVAWTKKAWSATWTWIKDTWTKIKTTTVEAATSIWNTVKEKFNQIKEAAIQKTTEMANRVVGKMLLLKNQALAKWIELKTKALIAINELKQKATDYFVDLANKIVGKVLLLKNQALAKWAELKVKTLIKINELKQEAADLFEQIKNKIKEKMSNAVQEVGKAVAKMPGKVLDFVGDMLSAGGDLVMGLIDGIKGMGTSAINAITGVVDGVVGKAKSLLKIKSPSRVFREMGQYVSQGLAIGVSQKAGMAVNNVASMASAMSNAFNPQLAMADMRASAQLDTSLSRADMGVVRKSFAAEIEPVEVRQGDTILKINGREFARATARDMDSEISKNKYQESQTGRKNTRYL